MTAPAPPDDDAMPLPIDTSLYRVSAGRAPDLHAVDFEDTQGVTKAEGRRELARNRRRLRKTQPVLYADGRQALLVVLQAMDTGGKDSTIRKVTRGVNPQGFQVTPFKAPCDHELARDFLWRVHDVVPRKGMVGIFNRSHYEDVLIVRVHGWADAGLIERRYEHINEFERMLADHGTRIVKIMLHISKAYQLERLRRRVRRPDKRWKFNPGDLKERARWDEYMAAYETALARCSTSWAPWYVVPAERRWYRNAVVSRILADTLDAMAPVLPPLDYDPADYPPQSLT